MSLGRPLTLHFFLGSFFFVAFWVLFLLPPLSSHIIAAVALEVVPPPTYLGRALWQPAKVMMPYTERMVKQRTLFSAQMKS